MKPSILAALTTKRASSSTTRATKSSYATKVEADELAEHREYLDAALQQLGFPAKLENWYKIPASRLAEIGGRRVLRKHHENLPRCLKAVYPEHTWHEWKFVKVPNDFWQNEDNQRRFLEETARGLGLAVDLADALNDLTAIDILQNGGRALLLLYNGSILKALKQLYPTHPWEEWRVESETLSTAFFKDEANLKRFFQSPHTLATLNIKEPSDWYRVSPQDIINVCVPNSRPAMSILLSSRSQAAQNSSLASLGEFAGESWLAGLLRRFLPQKEQRWLDWKFIHAQPSKQFWDTATNVRSFLLDHLSSLPQSASEQAMPLSERLQALTKKDIRAYPGGNGMLACFKGSLTRAIQFAFADSRSAPWRFARVPSGFWEDRRNQRAFLEWCEQELGVHSKEDWYRITSDQVVDLGGFTLLAGYKKYLPAALKSNFPEHEWQEWKFANVARGYWENLQNQRAFLDHVLRTVMGPNEAPRLEAWYTISPDKVVEHGGAILLKKHGHSLRRALEAVYSEHAWAPWLFQPQPQNLWNDVHTRKAYFDWLAPMAGVKDDLQEWYPVINADVMQRNSGGSLLLRYNQSPTLALMSAYPEHDWLPWKFAQVPSDFWVSAANRKRFFDWLAVELSIDSNVMMSKWYSVSSSDVASRGGGTLLAEFYGNSISNALRSVYPHHLWEPFKFLQHSSTMAKANNEN